MESALVDGIPVVWAEPERPGGTAPLALWLPPLTRSKEDAVPVLQQLAGNGFVAVSLDPWQHGERGAESAEQLATRVFGAFRRHMWPILGQSTLDCLRVVDWAAGELGAGGPVVAGGVSMGGDIAVALAGTDPRITRVAALVATPDWTRPGMRDLRDPSRILPQGDADGYAQWFYAHLDPMTHLDSYARGPAIAFECGAEDSHVPPDGALRFEAALAARYPGNRDRIRVTVHPGLGHIEAAQDPAALANALSWLTTVR